MIQGIKNIIFDLGGVILNIDYKLTETAFINSGITNFPELYSQLKQTTLFDDFETGKISKGKFIAALQDIAPCPISDEQIVTSWNAMLLNFPLRRLQILQQLRNQFELFLLSNTNEIHEEAFNKILFQNHGLPAINVLFERTYLSHRLGLRKPMIEIFELVLRENSLLPHETLFIDDSPQHIEGAKKAGIQTIYLQPGMTIEHDIFKPVG